MHKARASAPHLHAHLHEKKWGSFLQEWGSDGFLVIPNITNNNKINTYELSIVQNTTKKN